MMSVLKTPLQRAATCVPDIADISFDLLDTMEYFDDIDIKMEDLGADPSDNAYPAFEADEGLALFEFDRLRDLSLDLGTEAVVSNRGGEKRSLLLEDMDSGREQVIRQDCMWSAVHTALPNTAKFFKAASADGTEVRRGQPVLNSSSNNTLMGLTPPTSYIHQHLLLRHQFESPLASSEEDEDAQSSEDDIIQQTSLWSNNNLLDTASRLSAAVPMIDAVAEPLSASRDHSYFSCSSKKPSSSASVLTPPESSEDEDSYQGVYVSQEVASHLSTAQSNRITTATVRHDSQKKQQKLLQRSVSCLLASHRQATAAAAVTLPSHRSHPKFTFRINIKSTSATKKLNRLVRSRPLHHRHQQVKAALIRAAVDSGNATVVTSSVRLQERSDESERCFGEPKGARDLHNHNERQRRTDLKNAFDYLKRRVPAIATSERVSKQMILDKAIDFCRSLKAKEASVRQQHQLLTERNQLLRKKILSLKKMQKS